MVSGCGLLLDSLVIWSFQMSVRLKTTYLVFCWKLFVESVLKYTCTLKKVGKSEVLKTGAKGWCQTDWIQNCNLAPRNLCPWKFVDKKVTLFCFFCYQMMFLYQNFSMPTFLKCIIVFYYCVLNLVELAPSIDMALL